MRNIFFGLCLSCLLTFCFISFEMLLAVPVPPVETAIILTPAAPVSPRISGPKIYGVRPGAPFLYRIPCTGERPMTFTAKDLPQGLVLDGATGIITGNISKAGK